jgi:hypothetical protein
MQLNFYMKEIQNGVVIGWYTPDECYQKEMYFKEFVVALEALPQVVLEVWHDQKRRAQEVEEQQKKGYPTTQQAGASILGSPYMQQGMQQGTYGSDALRRGDDLDPRVVHGTEPASESITMPDHSYMGDDAQEYDPVDEQGIPLPKMDKTEGLTDEQKAKHWRDKL